MTTNRSWRSPLALLLPLTLLGAMCTEDRWDEHHASGATLDSARPECPVRWGTIPLFLQEKEVEQIRLKFGNNLPRGFTYATLLGETTLNYTLPNGIPASGPITDIPEFHDCQRFLTTPNAADFDSLYAIFAASRMEQAIDSLNWDAVTWTSSNPFVATVNAASGQVTALALGNTVVTGRSVADPTVTAQFQIAVVPPPSDTATGPLVSGVGSQMVPGQSRFAAVGFGAPTTSVIAAATIYSYGPGYPRLGIGPNFSCLYVYFDASRVLRAKVVNVVELDHYVDACVTAVDPTTPGLGTPLPVVRKVHGVFGRNAYPAVARWDLDDKNQQFIGVRCRDAWCEVGLAGGNSSPDYTLQGATMEEQRVAGIKGWYDEQILAVPVTEGSVDLRPSGLRGTVIPAPNLGALTQATISATSPQNLKNSDGPWTVVAHVALRDLSGDAPAVQYYHTKFGFELADVGGPLGSLNTLAYCFGTRDQCDVAPKTCWLGWFKETFWDVSRVWVRIQAPSGAITHRCIIRRDHSDIASLGLSIVPTSRWRWILSDDTIWTACVQGCCEMEG
jgi:hypothetical protein